MNFNHCLIFLLPFLHRDCIVLASGEVNCSRSESDIVHIFLKEKVFPAYDKMELTIPKDCLWNKERDIFSRQYFMMKKYSEENWKCEFCGKEFYSESYIWRHMDNKHYDQLNKVKNHVCLGNFCQIFRCEILSNRYNKPTQTNWAKKLCNHNDMNQLKIQCNKIVDDCLTNQMSNRNVLRDYLYSTICEFLSCEKYWQSSSKPTNWVLNIYIALAAFIVGLIVYYIALFVRLNNVDINHFNDRPKSTHECNCHAINYRGAELTFRGSRNFNDN